MNDYRRLFNLSYQRAISPNYEIFFKRFYDKLIGSDPDIEALFSDTDMERQFRMLMQSMTHITSFAATLEADEEIDRIAKLHGKDNLKISTEIFDLWLDCLIDTVREHDPEYNHHVETAWKEIMSPGLEYMKSFCHK